ncbi:nucleoside 2-deoxyribosyltransferase [Geomonas nitrogeniifigens]|uniref:Nucleoside 2-deoxyribosyltransferase n=1 Tax=Geomonas diazotrophica TaxID=2843197 RepID=A0ABX8JIF2_9BACT|nr:nucleoside 2-deoxyribosyltransferase [Geomonas nitrogeniifigens]QWV97761.1 nucleoside 2-deoxyribosyltransferase [Geomonas nitrogeniifigens]
MSYTIYFAGGLFNHKDLIGNLLVGEKISAVSNGKYICNLPQNIEVSAERAEQIRNNDIKSLLCSDLGIFNFDGTELDSGTVVEYMIAKMIDMPCVLLRTDFRSGGDQGHSKDQWNLMCSFYPRSKTVNINSMAWYQEYFSPSSYSSLNIDQAYSEIATQIITALDEVRSMPSLLENYSPSLMEIYKWAITFPGSGFDTLFSDEELRDLVTAKSAKGIYTAVEAG